MIVTKRWRGMRWTQAVSNDDDTDADGKAVWSWRPDAGVKLCGVHPLGDGGKQAGHRGERGISRKPLRRESRIVAVNLW